MPVSSVDLQHCQDRLYTETANERGKTLVGCADAGFEMW